MSLSVLLCNVCVCYVYILKMSKKIKVKKKKKTIPKSNIKIVEWDKICTPNVICENVVFVLCNNYHGLNIPYKLTSLNRKLTGLAFLSMIAIKIFIHHAPWSIIQYEPLVLDKYP